MLDLNNFDRMKIGLASSEKMRSWSSGEVKKPETINYRTLKPEKEGLFCEKIFGPTKDWECHCGKYKRIRYKGVICDRCGVEVTRSKVRRERLGHIELAAPCAHIWYLKGIPSRLGLLLDVSPRVLEKIIYFVSYIVIDPGEATLKGNKLVQKQILTENEYREIRNEHGDKFEAGIGAEAILRLLRHMDLETLHKNLRVEIKETTGQRRIRATRRLEVVEAFQKSLNDPSWMILEVIPVLPPDLRPMVQLDGGRFATSDLNDLYRRVINRNNRLKKLLDLDAPEIIIRNEKRMLQEAVDALIDNGRRGRPVTGPGNRPLKSLSDMLKGKQGRFRQNLLGKRVDYSGRSVIVIGPNLKMHQCGLPKEMALELFKPFVMKKLVEEDFAQNIKNAKRMVESGSAKVWDVLESVIKDHPVLLNRAPTLHRLGIQAFEPVLVEGRALKLHPLVCTAYNADFDGDQMAVHVPLSAEAQSEARLLMLASNNILNPKDGKPVVTPTQDLILGSYYMTIAKDEQVGEGKMFFDFDDVTLAYENDIASIHARIKVKAPEDLLIIGLTDKVEVKKGEFIDTTVGRVLFNSVIPGAIGFFNTPMRKKELGKLVARAFEILGASKTAEMLDGIKTQGFKFSTKAGITISVDDIKVPEIKKTLLDAADLKVEVIEKKFRRGIITEEERYNSIIKTWDLTTEELTAELLKNLDLDNNINMMAESGARGNIQQIRQLAGMRGLMADPSGKTIELPIKSNFREGLTILEYFISTHGARKGLADTALRTADSGYLTRRLVDVSQDLIVRDDDCGTEEGIEVIAIKDGNEVIEELQERIEGRTALYDFKDPKTKEIIVAKGKIINVAAAEKIIAAGFEKVGIRTTLTCRSKHGVCRKCYGINLATGLEAEVGEAVGIIAAQSIGEPGTQLTMRTFHTGGVAGGDITQGLPRIEELFEARKPKGLAVITELTGTVKIKEEDRKKEITVTSEEGEAEAYLILQGSRLRVKNGDFVQAGDILTEGSVNPHDLLRIKGARGVQDYLLQEVQKVYRMQGVDINDKHIEVIVRQMLKKVKVEDSNDTEFLPGSLVDILDFQDVNEKVIGEGGEGATASAVLLGITKASLATDSFLSAASFQETTRVLTDAAIKGKEDPLIGLKENVIIGKLIPAGTGTEYYRKIKMEKALKNQEVASIIDDE